eukprot:4501082-Pleurochrysis_carterae.AAC.6
MAAKVLMQSAIELPRCQRPTAEAGATMFGAASTLARLLRCGSTASARKDRSPRPRRGTEMHDASKATRQNIKAVIAQMRLGTMFEGMCSSVFLREGCAQLGRPHAQQASGARTVNTEDLVLYDRSERKRVEQLLKLLPQLYLRGGRAQSARDVCSQ